MLALIDSKVSRSEMIGIIMCDKYSTATHIIAASKQSGHLNLRLFGR